MTPALAEHKPLRTEAEFRHAWIAARALEIYGGWERRYDVMPRDCTMDAAWRTAVGEMDKRMGDKP